MRKKSDAIQVCLNLLSAKDYFERELREKLEKRDFSKKEIESAMERLKELNYLGDEELAGRYVQSYLKRGKGPLWIRMKLFEKCREPSIVDQALSALCEEEVLEALEAWIYRKKLHRTSREKSLRLLASRGFLTHQIYSVIERLQSASEEELEPF